MTVLDYADKILLALPGTDSGVYLLSFATAIGTPVGIVSAGINLLLLVANGIFITFLKKWEGKK